MNEISESSIELSTAATSTNFSESLNHGTDVEMIDIEEPENESPYYLPINAVSNIFKFLDADELENARLVCKTWKSVIDAHRTRLCYRDVQALHLSTNCEFTFALYSGYKVYRYCCQKFFSEFDQEMRSKEQLYIRKDGDFEYKLPCRCPLLKELVASVEYVPGQLPDSRVHLFSCTVRLGTPDLSKNPLCNCLIYNPKKRRLYAKQYFTPPLFWYQKLEEMTAFTNIKMLVFYHYSIVETTADMLKRWRGTFYVDKVVFHNINLRSVSKEQFHALLTESIVAKEYHLNYVTKALPHHFNSELFLHPTMLQAQSINIGTVLNRDENRDWVKFEISEEQFLEFVNHPIKRKDFKFLFRNFNFTLDSWRKIHMKKKHASFEYFGHVPKDEEDLTMQLFESDLETEEDDDD